MLMGIPSYTLGDPSGSPQVPHTELTLFKIVAIFLTQRCARLEKATPRICESLLVVQEEEGGNRAVAKQW